MQLLSQSKTNQFEKQALSQLAKGMSTLAARKDFIGGLLAPLVKTYGGVQRAVGYTKQLPAVIKNPSATRNVLKKDKLFSQGAKDIQKGDNLRQQAAFEKIFNSKNPLSYRVGRGLGAATIGLPIITAPITIPRYLGAASADTDLAKEYAKNRAYERIENRLNQFSEIPFLDRIQTAWNPTNFTKNLESPEAASVYESIANNNINNPGILKYLSSFNPFVSNPQEVIRQKIRSEILKSMQTNKSASELIKQANTLQQIFTKILKPAYAFGKKTRGIPQGAKLPKKIKPYDPYKRKSYLEGVLGDAAIFAGKHPVLAPVTTIGTALTPFSMYNSYQSGKQQVYDDAASVAEGLADLGIMEKFNQPGFMGGLNRFGMAMAPGIGQEMILKQIRQSMFPELNRQQY
jgi:hypothetical protein